STFFAFRASVVRGRTLFAALMAVGLKVGTRASRSNNRLFSRPHAASRYLAHRSMPAHSRFALEVFLIFNKKLTFFRKN
ncbi:MAG: hypothetical protein J6V16_08870, partial [Bacteroidales bacterium]|nr:hypothetical protein [Bacteroidales bacterium]